METLGYHGSILRVDLGSGTSDRQELDPVTARRFAGCGLLATKILLDDTPAGLDPYDPRSLLIVASSVIAGQPYPGLARFTINAMSPLTGGIGEARCEGPFAASLKRSGADALVVAGQAADWSVIVVQDGSSRVVRVPEISGLRVNEAADVLEGMFGRGIDTLLIGPAGERLVRFASATASRTHQAARGGLGAVFGSKRLKGIVVVPGDLPPVADPARCDQIAAAYRGRLLVNPLTAWQATPPGFSAWGGVHGEDTALAIANYQQSVDPDNHVLEPAAFMARYVGISPCPGCPGDCIMRFEPATAPGDPRATGMHQEITGSIGINLGITRIDTLFRVNQLCTDLGIDPVGLGYTLSMAFECSERGLLDPAMSGGLLRFGDDDAVLRLTEAIANREGFGDLLAEGSLRAATAIGNGAERHALQVKGAEMVPFEPRTQAGLALGYATAAVGPRYDYLEHDWDYDTRYGWPHTLDGSRALEILDRVPMDQLSDEKIVMFKALTTLWSALDALGVCEFAGPPTRALTLQEVGDLLSAITGWEASAWEVMRLGERRLHLMRAYNLREGLTAADDTLPNRFFDEPVPAGGFAGAVLDRDRFHAAIQTWYRMMGWTDDGVPTRATLLDHHLGWVLDNGHLPDA